MSDYVSVLLRQLVEKDARYRCGYCLSPQQYVMGKLHLEHILPKALGGETTRDNLWLACSLCNDYKLAQTHAIDPKTGYRMPLFNPRRQKWQRHFYWSTNGVYVMGKTRCGRASIEAIQLNNDLAIEVRTWWVSAGWHPPKD